MNVVLPGSETSGQPRSSRYQPSLPLTVVPPGSPIVAPATGRLVIASNRTPYLEIHGPPRMKMSPRWVELAAITVPAMSSPTETVNDWPDGTVTS